MVGLGNPGPEYEETRHNAGFEVVAELARRHGGRWNRRLGVPGEVARVHLAGEVILLRPLTYMNASGDAVRPLVRRLGLAPADVVVVFDDMDLPPGRLRIRPGGSSGGHRGVASVVAALGTEAFPRVRVGIGRPPEGVDPVDYVLSRIPGGERAAWQAALARAADAVEVLATEGLAMAMQRFNGAEPPPPAR